LDRAQNGESGGLGHAVTITVPAYRYCQPAQMQAPFEEIGGLSVSLGQVAALIAAIAFLLLCGALAVPILRLRHTVDAATNTINDINDRTGPILGNVNTTIENVNTALTQAHTTLEGVNLQLARLDTITEHVSHVTANVSNLATVVTSAAPAHWARRRRSGSACAGPTPSAGPARRRPSCVSGSSPSARSVVGAECPARRSRWSNGSCGSASASRSAPWSPGR